MLLIQPQQSFYILALLLFAVAFGIYGEHKGWFKLISGALVTIIVGVILTSARILPNGSDPGLDVPVYNFAFKYLVLFSIPLLLFNADFRKILKSSGKLMIIFLIGSLSVTVGSVIAYYLIDLGPETYKLSAAYTATYTGGSVNFIAVADSFDFIESDLFAASIVVDNVVTILFIVLLFYLPKLYGKIEEKEKVATATTTSEKMTPHDILLKMSIALLIAGVTVAFGIYVADFVEKILNTSIKLDALMITIIILLIANFAPRLLMPFEKIAFQIGMYMLYFFLAVIGATCDLYSLITASPKVIFFAVTIMSFHLLILLLAGRIFKYDIREISIASAANIGGASIAAPMSATFNMRKNITSAILIGIMGNAIGTFLGLFVGILFR
jgi:uncharacterized membrane protein